MTFSVTLKDLRTAGACIAGYNRVVCALQGVPYTRGRTRYIRHRHPDEIPLEFILASNGLLDALWATRCVQGHDRDLRLFAVWWARQVQHLATDPRVGTCLDVAESFANGGATVLELRAALTALGAAPEALYAAERVATRAAMGAAATRPEVMLTVLDAAWAAAHGEGVRTGLDDLTTMFLKMLKGEAPWQENQV